MQNSIVLISDNEKISKQIEKKVILLRKVDSFKSIEHKNCFEKIKDIKPVLIIYHLKKAVDENYSEIEKDIFLNFVQKTKQTKNLKSSSIILLYEEIDENLLCSAFEKGLTDFLHICSTDTEFTIRTIWCLQKRETFFELERKNNILSHLNIIEEDCNVFTENYTFSVIKEQSKNNWGTFVSLSPDINIRSKISPQTLMTIIKKTVRSSDILGFASDFKIYLWFGYTKKEDVLKILEKIKTTLTKDYTISAGYIETKNIEFDKAEELANTALSKALLKGNTFLYAKEPKKNIKDLNIDIKNYKLQKQLFVKKIKSLISPIFYQIQKINEEKLFETKINQTVEDDYSNFSLQNENGKGTLTFNYPGYTKIDIEIIYDIKNEDLKTDKIFVDTDDINDKKIEYYLERFIRDFKNYTKC